jgi:hypothetical protein
MPAEGAHDQSVAGAGQAVAYAQALRNAVRAHLESEPSDRVHLFLAGPGGLALLLGHRWNCVAPTTVYEHLGPGKTTLAARCGVPASDRTACAATSGSSAGRSSTAVRVTHRAAGSSHASNHRRGSATPSAAHGHGSRSRDFVLDGALPERRPIRPTMPATEQAARVRRPDPGDLWSTWAASGQSPPPGSPGGLGAARCFTRDGRLAPHAVARQHNSLGKLCPVHRHADVQFLADAQRPVSVPQTPA